MPNQGTTFLIKQGSIDRLSRSLGKRFVQYDKEIERRTKLATNLVWRVAHQKRPIISKTIMKATGRSYRVSDPTAELGVPVKTGNLQSSIRQEVTRSGMSFQGKVYTKGIPYAGYMEYGTSEIAPRPFMRPAVALNEEAIKRLYGMRIESNV